jgi:hypothetical protein
VNALRYIPFVSNLDLRLMLGRQPGCMTQVEFVPERTADGTVVLRARVVGAVERLRRLARRLMQSFA